MKQKLQFPMFYLAWVATILAGIFSICGLPSATLKLLGGVALCAYVYFRESGDEITLKLLRFLAGMQLEFMLCSLLCGQVLWAVWFLATLVLSLFEIDEEVRELGYTE